MKKILSILFLALTLTLFNSCLFLLPDSFNYTPKYDITCQNDTQKTITDWCVKKSDDSTFANSEYARQIKPGRSDTISSLSPGYYSLCFSFMEKTKLQPSDYEQTDAIYLDEDVVFSVAKRGFYGRAAESTSDENAEAQYVVIINGKEYPLHK